MNFLSEQELIDLTDYQRPCDQKRWLRENGFKYLESSKGRPKVLKSVVESELGKKTHVDRPTLRQVG